MQQPPTMPPLLHHASGPPWPPHWDGNCSRWHHRHKFKGVYILRRRFLYDVVEPIFAIQAENINSKMSPAAIADLETTPVPVGQQNGANVSRPGSGAAPSIPIAIVGMACRFPGDVSNPSQLWDLCVSGRDGWTPIPKDRFDVNSLYHKTHDRVGRSHVQGGYFMKGDISLFDAAFFSLASDVASVSLYLLVSS